MSWEMGFSDDKALSRQCSHHARSSWLDSMVRSQGVSLIHKLLETAVVSSPSRP